MIYLLRFFTGFVCFSISGSRPGAFVNLLIKSGINVWGVRSRSGEILCCAAVRDYPEILRIGREHSRKIRSVKKWGLPFIIEKNRHRSGLLVGAVCFLLVFKLLSMFIWTVDICDLQYISRTAAADVLRRVGMYEGVRGEFDSLKRMQTSAMIEFGSLSWITINADGSYGEVNATEKVPIDTNDTAPRNMTAATDGQIIRTDAYKGTSVLNAGDGAAKGDLLISGIVETESGGLRLERADGIVLAKTQYDEFFAAPKKYQLAVCDIEPATRRRAVPADDTHLHQSRTQALRRYSCRLFGIVIPLSAASADEHSLVFYHEKRAAFADQSISASLITEELYPYSIIEGKADADTAEERLKRSMLLWELFSYNDREITDRHIVRSESKDAYFYDVNYKCIENIAKPSPISAKKLLIERSDTTDEQ